jgi:hypothetical protein
MNVVLAEHVLNVRVKEFQSAIGLHHVRNAFREYPLERVSHRRSAFIFDGYGESVPREHVDAGKYVSISVVTRRQISHVGEIGLKQIVYAFGERPSTGKFSNRRFVQGVWILRFQPPFHRFHGRSAVPSQREGRRTNRARLIRNTPIHQFSQLMSAYL